MSIINISIICIVFQFYIEYKVRYKVRKHSISTCIMHTTQISNLVYYYLIYFYYFIFIVLYWNEKKKYKTFESYTKIYFTRWKVLKRLDTFFIKIIILTFHHFFIDLGNLTTRLFNFLKLKLFHPSFKIKNPQLSFGEKNCMTVVYIFLKLNLNLSKLN